jgi:hypothetical protein
MSTQNTLTAPDTPRRIYPLSGTTRLNKRTLERIKKYGGYAESIDTIVSKLLDRLEEFERRGYNIPEENQSF